MEVLILRYSKYHAGDKMIKMIIISTNPISFKSDKHIIMII